MFLGDGQISESSALFFRHIESSDGSWDDSTRFNRTALSKIPPLQGDKTCAARGLSMLAVSKRVRHSGRLKAIILVIRNGKFLAHYQKCRRAMHIHNMDG